MISTDQVTESSRYVQPEIPEHEPADRPYATLWLADKEVQLFEDENGEFFTA